MIGEKGKGSRTEDFEEIAQKLSSLVEKVAGLDTRLNEVEQVVARLEGAALSTSHGLAEISRHWDAVYEAMRREEAAEEER